MGRPAPEPRHCLAGAHGLRRGTPDLRMENVTEMAAGESQLRDRFDTESPTSGARRAHPARKGLATSRVAVELVFRAARIEPLSARRLRSTLSCTTSSNPSCPSSAVY